MGDFVISACGLELVQVLVLSREPVEKLACSYGVVPDAHMVEFSADWGRDFLAIKQSLSIPLPF